MGNLKEFHPNLSIKLVRNFVIFRIGYEMVNINQLQIFL